MENKRPIPDENEIEDLKEKMEQYMEVIRTATDMSGLPPEMIIDFLGDEILRILDESGGVSHPDQSPVVDLPDRTLPDR